MHSKYLSRVLMIFVNHCAASKFRYTHNTISMIHPVLLYRINSRIDFTARTVEISGMYMNTKRFATYHFGMYTGRISQPVVRMDNIKFLLTGYYSGNDREVINFLVQVSGITSCKLHTSQIIDVHIRKIGINMIAERIVFFRRHLQQARLQVVIIDITPYNRYLVHTDYF